MADKHPDPRKPGGSKKRRGRKSKRVAEIFALLDQVPATSPVARLAVDQVRDACRETFVKQTAKIDRLSSELIRAKKKRSQFYSRFMKLLQAAASGFVVLPRQPSLPAVEHDQLVQTLREFKSPGFNELAQTLHTSSGRSGVTAFQTFLVDTILIEGSQIVVEQLILHANEVRSEEEETRFQNRIRDHIGKKVSQGLARTVGYQMTPEIGEQRDDLIGQAIAFLNDLLTATPAGRLLAPPPDSPFDPERHEAIPGRPNTGELKVMKTLFPGYVVLGNPDRVIEKASVYTDRAAGK